MLSHSKRALMRALYAVRRLAERSLTGGTTSADHRLPWAGGDGLASNPAADSAGGFTGGQRSFPVYQVRTFRTFSLLLGGRGGRRLHIWSVFQKPVAPKNRGFRPCLLYPECGHTSQHDRDVRFVP
jgi:hypothetical protein